MKFTPTPLQGAWVIEPEPITDPRGSFARLWCKQTFEAQGLTAQLAQISVSSNVLKGTVRGMHFQWQPSQETKLVRCQRGSVFDVIVDLRPHSPTFKQVFFVVLDSEKHNALYIPPGFAHGFQSLQDNSELHYMMTDIYRADLYAGVRYNDPAFNIPWPLAVSRIHERDVNYPDFDESEHSQRYFQTVKNE